MSSVSYIVPVYNAEKYIARCIESCLNNMYAEDELILVDDGSIDHSGEICDSYANRVSNIKVIHQINGGESAARNAGMEAAVKEWIVCVDADDFLVKGARKILEKTDADVDLIIYSFQQEDITGHVQGNATGAMRDYEAGDLFILSGFRGKTDFLPCNKISLRAVWAKAFRTAFIKQNGIKFHEGVFYGEDFEFMLECYSRASVIRCVDEVLYYYFFQHSESMTNRYKPDLVENTINSSNAMQEWLEKFPQYKDDYAAYSLNMLVLHIRDDFFHAENKMNAEEKYQHMEDVIERGGYKEYYEMAVRSGKIKKYSLYKRILFYAAIHKYYKLLKFIYTMRYR